eukprot:CAMPEP_0117077528 /NCGR_PEP_ID=MMETSP0472-20121206/54668_1 /TAXON_ID=693140 ORGANISM="Tiarina fusus, Strain LIS" /NCGR_SAMPLE_ID=MMETSP0472 /ASSEMBLY_ACC=CAM_ASM_000603 /LENGTH=70 /DNA_ID=CAMNT_0004803907 /DNA_START=36 /DNA_END=244 /DNA_ORIENTATION=+
MKRRKPCNGNQPSPVTFLALAVVLGFLNFGSVLCEDDNRNNNDNHHINDNYYMSNRQLLGLRGGADQDPS